MNKMMLASLGLLLAGATALPVAADDDKRRAGGETSWQDKGRQGDKGRYREESRDQRQGNRGERHDDRDDDRDDRRDWRADNRDQRYDHRDDRRDHRDDNRYARYDNRDGHDNRYRDYRGGHGNYRRHDDRRWNGYHWYPQYRYRAPVRYVYPPGYRAYQWRVGHRLPRGYYGRPYYVDYNYYRLPPPPYGYGWVRVDRDVVLVALATGLIIDALYGLYY
jgi:Ni/Co efflux regulator RcnB